MDDLDNLPQDAIFARDMDGTGSMHICLARDPGAVPFVRVNLLADALQTITLLRADLAAAHERAERAEEAGIVAGLRFAASLARAKAVPVHPLGTSIPEAIATDLEARASAMAERAALKETTP